MESQIEAVVAQLNSGAHVIDREYVVALYNLLQQQQQIIRECNEKLNRKGKGYGRKPKYSTEEDRLQAKRRRQMEFYYRQKAKGEALQSQPVAVS